MDYNMIEQVKNLHIENGYFIAVEKTAKGQLSISYPGNILEKPNLMPFVAIYDISTEGLITKIVSDSDTPIKFKAPNYSRRILIMADVILECMHRDLTEDLLVGDGDMGFLEMLDFLPAPEEKKKEKKLETVLVNMIANNEFVQRVSEDIEEGYQLICQILNIGGI